MTKDPPVVLLREHFDTLLDALQRRGYTVVGPTVQDRVIVYDEIGRAGDLPIGWTDEQDGGHYRLKRRDDEAFFGYVVGPQSWKKYLHPPQVRLVKADRDDNGAMVFSDGDDEELPRYAFLGMRSCELHAMTIQDKVFLGSGAADSHYERRRRRIFSIGVSCGEAGGTCFCVSMDTGPQVSDRTPHDLALTEVLDGEQHFFVFTAGSDEGREVLAELPTTPASGDEVSAAKERVSHAAASMGRSMNPKGVQQLLSENLEHPQWEDLAQRCLSCANCTMVCPTCFCTTVEDVTDLTGDHAERWRRWDSCFTMDFTKMHGGSARQSVKSRYRQWLTHKLSTWHDQFDSSGCVGCGRCITWCPVGIDLTQEVAAFRDSENKPQTQSSEP
jgi:sulfhydrogenase subunit beta (sulfur reductase)